MGNRIASIFLFLMILLAPVGQSCTGQESMPMVEVSADKTHFVFQGSSRRFPAWGFNYDHDTEGRLLEDYWSENWDKIETDFEAMRRMHAKVVRIHLQIAKFMKSPAESNQQSLKLLAKLVKLAEQKRLYLDITGLGCYHKSDVPAWYDELGETERWEAQAQFWRQVAACCVDSPAIFCYDLMNEPVVPGGRREPKDWLGPPFGDKSFVQFITLDQAGRARSDIARQWTAKLVKAIRQVDDRHLVTVGLVDWSLDRPGLTSGFDPRVIVPELDFASVHVYPESGKLDVALETLQGFKLGKPVVVEETFPLRCTSSELQGFIRDSSATVSGWISFYWGPSANDDAAPESIAEAITRDWLRVFEKMAETIE